MTNEINESNRTDLAMRKFNDELAEFVSEIQKSNREKKLKKHYTMTTVENLVKIVEKLFGIFDSKPDVSDTVLSNAERRRKIGAGIKSFAIGNADDSSAITNKMIFPSYPSIEKLGDDLGTHILLCQLFNVLNQFESSVSEIMMLYADNAYRHTKQCNGVKTADSNVHGATSEYEMMHKCFKHGKYSSPVEPEEKNERYVRALLNGRRKDGKMSIENERKYLCGGRHFFSDEIFSEQSRTGNRLTKMKVF